MDRGRQLPGIRRDFRKESADRKTDPDEIKKYYELWGVRMLASKPHIAREDKWLFTPRRFGHPADELFHANHRTFGDILGDPYAAPSIEMLLLDRLPHNGKPLLFYGNVAQFLNGVIASTNPDASKQTDGLHRFLTAKSLVLIRAFKAAKCYPDPSQTKDLVKQPVVKVATKTASSIKTADDALPRGERA
jgi:hypothetical protein